MATYLILGTITYSTTAGRTTAMTAMNNAVNANANVTAVAIGALPAGINTTGTAGVNISLRCADTATADSFRFTFLTAWSSAARTSNSIMIVKET